MSPILLILIVLLIFGAPSLGYWHSPQYGMGFGGILVIILVVLLLTGRL
jgi:hypothetical protein